MTDLPIVPARSIGSFTIGAPLADLSKRLMSEVIARLGADRPYRLATVFEAEYELESVVLGVNVLTGRIFKCSLRPPTRAAYAGVFLGMTVAEARIANADLEWNDLLEILVLPDIPGLAFQVDRHDPETDEQLAAARIDELSVFDPAVGLTPSFP
jgi:hypothetical protein